MKHRITLLFMLLSISCIAQEWIFSPNKELSVRVNLDHQLKFEVLHNNQVLIKTLDVDLSMNGSRICEEKIQKIKTYDVSDYVTLDIPYKNRKVDNRYQGMTILFKNKVEMELRLYNDAFVYRFVQRQKGEHKINESLHIVFNDDHSMWSSPINGFSSSYESDFPKIKISELKASQNSYLPVLVDCSQGKKVLVTEANVSNYPHMFLSNGGVHALKATFPKFPIDVELIGDRKSEVHQTAPYIAKTNGVQHHPWRVFVITDNDAKIVNSDIIPILADKVDQSVDLSWIKPGRVAWDWWNAANIYGVDFKTGYNTKTWMAYVDFASEHGLEYVILDEGWSISTLDITKPNPDLDLQALIEYAKSKNVELILWSTWRALEKDISIIKTYAEWGIAGIKVDFMDRADQWMVNFVEEIARETFNNKLIVDFHGAFKPTGLRFRYPNIVSYEGVYGLENCKWSAKVTPEHNLTLPFTRMVAGPMDYTPGAMRNYHANEFVANFNRPSSIGTRSHQVALFVAFESGIQMFADSPSNYNKELETVDFIADIPVVWDETDVQEAKVGEHLLLARRHNNTWFVAGLTGAEARQFTPDFGFLDEGNYNATIFKDGVNVELFAEDYAIEQLVINQHSQLTISAFKGGGFTMKLEKAE